MAVPILEQRKKLRRLIPVLAAVILVTGFVIWQGFFAKPKTQVQPEALAPAVSKSISIDWSVLKSPALRQLDLFEEINPLEGKAGRENPFVPY